MSINDGSQVILSKMFIHVPEFLVKFGVILRWSTCSCIKYLLMREKIVVKILLINVFIHSLYFQEVPSATLNVTEIDSIETREKLTNAQISRYSRQLILPEIGVKGIYLILV